MTIPDDDVSQLSPSEIIAEQAKEISIRSRRYGDRHNEIAGIWIKTHYVIGILNIILSTVAACTTFYDNKILTGILAMLVGALSGVITFLRPDQKAYEHEVKARKMWNIANRARFLYRGRLPVDGANAAMRDLRKIQKAFEKTCNASPTLLRTIQKIDSK
jgi:hypothetical protein